MSVLKQDIDVRLIARWLGVEGAKAGLRESRHITVEVLLEIAHIVLESIWERERLERN